MRNQVARRNFIRTGAAGAAGLATVATGLAVAEAQSRPSGASLERPPAPSAPADVIARMRNGFQLTQLLYVAAKLRIADQLSAGPKSVDELAEQAGVKADPLYRVLRALTRFEVFHEEQGRRFRLTPAAELLRSGVAGSQRAAAEAMGEEWMWRSWGALLESVKTGRTGFDTVYGMNTFDWFATHPEAARIFDAFQADGTVQSAHWVATTYDFSSARLIVDVGGGDGTLLAAILRHHAGVRGILFDLPHVVDAAKASMDLGISQRCQFVGGDFFKSVPPGGDLYVLKAIIHDWEESRGLEILANMRRVVPRDGTLLVIEDLICAPNVPCSSTLGDVNMLARTGGRNRTEAEYRSLLQAGGFTVRRVIEGPRAILVAQPA